jgi:hypothetical protein
MEFSNVAVTNEMIDLPSSLIAKIIINTKSVNAPNPK